jgi:NitT/TauT family transport system ATP-binding protein
MPQRDELLPWYSAIDNAALALRNQGRSRAEARRGAAELFDRFGLAGFERKAPQELSGGMRQRVAFLRTLVSGKPVLALDEPFAALDAITRGQMQEWLAAALHADPRTVVLVTHDVEEALYLADHVAVLSARPARIVEQFETPAPRAADRDAAVTDPAFVAARERALRALHEGAR